MDLKTQFLGMTLKNPFVVGSSPLANTLDRVKKLEDAGAAALVLHSLFEEQIIHETQIPDFEDERYGKILAGGEGVLPAAEEFPNTSESYLKLIQDVKSQTEIPVIASLNGISEGVWIEYARLIEEAGADALELNLYTLPTHDDDSSHYVEKRLVEIVDVTRNSVSIPLSVKISSRHTSICNFAQRIEYAGANGLVVFNRVFSADFDFKNQKLTPKVLWSQPNDLLERLRWVSILYPQLKMDLAVTGGVHSGEGALKSVLCGAAVVQCVTHLMKEGIDSLSTMIDEFTQLAEENGYSDLSEVRGSLSKLLQPDPEIIERANYLRILQGWSADGNEPS